MSLVSDVLTLLRRPLSASTDDAPRPRGRPQLATSPVSEADILEAIGRCHTERAAAENAISGYGDRREALLLQDNSDAAIGALDKEISSGNLALERLDRLEPELERRLAEVRELLRREKWIEIRNRYVEAGRRHLEVLQRFIDMTGDHVRQRNESLADFREAPLPEFPAIPAKVIQQFAADLDRLSNTLFDGTRRPQPWTRSVADILREDGPDAMPAAFGELVPRGAREVGIRYTVEIRPSDDPLTWTRIGKIEYLKPAEALELIRAGRAEMIGAR